MVHTDTTNNVADVGRALALEEEICLSVIPVYEILRTISARETHISKRDFGIFLYMANMIETLKTFINVNLGKS